MKRKYIYIFCPKSWVLRSLLMHFNRLNHTVKEHALNVHGLTPSSPRRLMYACTLLFGFCKILDIVKLHIIKTTITILSQTIYISHTPTVKAQKSIKTIVRIVHLPSVVQSEFYEATRILFIRKENKNNDIYSTIRLLSVSLCQRSAILESIRWTQSAYAILCHQ